MPLEPERRKLKPSSQARVAKRRYQRGWWERVRRMAMTKPKRILRAPRVRPKIIRDLLPLVTDQRMKFGWDWFRRVSVTIFIGAINAEG